jgi:hypothetical protein
MKKNKKNDKKKYFVSVMAGTGAVIVALFVVLAFVIYQKDADASINSFDDCAAKYPVMESYPERCMTSDGRSFTNQ